MIQNVPAKPGRSFLGVLTDCTAVENIGDGELASPLESWRKMAANPARFR